MKVLITGATGQLGRCLQDKVHRYFAKEKCTLLLVGSKEVDIRSAAAVDSFIEAHRPDYVINAAAYTAVDRAEQEAQQAFNVNAKGAENLARATVRYHIPLIHISTDYVFDGAATTPYKCHDTASPQTVYGITKLAGEKRVAALNPQHVIIRTAWMFSEYGHNFVKTMLRLGEEKAELQVVADQSGCPTYAGDLASTIWQMLSAINQDTHWPYFGIHHYCGDQATSWHGFAREIIAQGLAQGLITQAPLLTAVTTADFKTLAPRPAYSVLDCSELPVDNDRDWRKSLHYVISALANEIK